MARVRDIPVRTLRIFAAVAEARSFREAAARLGISQPTVSLRISDLELAAGAVLVERRTGRTADMALTEAGEELLPRVREALAAHDRMIEWFDRPRRPRRLR